MFPDTVRHRGRRRAGAGVFELTTASLALGGAYVERWGQDFGEEFGKVHVIEILGGDPAGDPGKIIHDNRLQAACYADVFNTPITIDLELAKELGLYAPHGIASPVMITCRAVGGRSDRHSDVALWYVVKAVHRELCRGDPREFPAVRWFDFASIAYERTDPTLSRVIRKLARCRQRSGEEPWTR